MPWYHMTSTHQQLNCVDSNMTTPFPSPSVAEQRSASLHLRPEAMLAKELSVPSQNCLHCQYINTGKTMKTHTRLQFCTNLFVHNIDWSCWFILKFCTEHGSITAMLCVKFQNDWATEKLVVGQWYVSLRAVWGVVFVLQQVFCKKMKLPKKQIASGFTTSYIM